MRHVRSGVLAAALAGLLLGTACSDDPQKPLADVEVKIQTARFFPSDVNVQPGRTVLWVNVLRKAPENVRTVTSGTGPGDPNAGALFDVTLEGFDPGEAFGDTYVHRFPDNGEFPYFSRFPAGDTTFTGVIRVP